MRHHVVEDETGRRVGIVSQTDVVLNQGIEHYLKLRRVDALVKGGLHAPPAAAGLGEATRRMREGGWTRSWWITALQTPAPEGATASSPSATSPAWWPSVADRALGEPRQPAARHLPRRRQPVPVRIAARRAPDPPHRRARRRRRTGRPGQLGDILSGMELAYVHELHDAPARARPRVERSQRPHLAEKVIESSLEGVMVTDAHARILREPRLHAHDRICAGRGRRLNPSVLNPAARARPLRPHAGRTAGRRPVARRGWNRRKTGEVIRSRCIITAIRDREGVLTHYAALFHRHQPVHGDRGAHPRPRLLRPAHRPAQPPPARRPPAGRVPTPHACAAGWR